MFYNRFYIIGDRNNNNAKTSGEQMGHMPRVPKDFFRNSDKKHITKFWLKMSGNRTTQSKEIFANFILFALNRASSSIR